MANGAAAIQALGDPTRREIFERISKCPLAVVEIAEDLPISRPAVSQHLKVLKDVGLVRVRRNGTRHLYYADPKGVEIMRKYLDRLWERALTSLKTFSEESH
ncbi:ArsR family transcriptional regulator [Leptospira fluminis]|uniref:ArsR family transcriptional regulator n=1 Tax=Leptospira fluminis TaxID=2484979 RepID=A0A4R9GR20_9LEPT|nr:metalloregulator ArsR/SmtB family transcription factor [Leptospira fluminis]TGK18742.1 ArsR family transcriptional regulator [Leptospira fluminis]